MRPLRETDPELRRAIVTLNRRMVPEADEWALIRSLEDGEALLLRLVSDDQVADLPRTNGISLLVSMQFRTSVTGDSHPRRPDAVADTVLRLLKSSREKVREAAAIACVRLLRLSPLTTAQPFRESGARIVTGLREAMVDGRFNARVREYLEHMIPRLDSGLV
jgi:hypothetical protein